ncbi:hypothetical protein V9Z23_09735, partial [Streptococcus suis]|uniref:hypothetical protein n=1 Tax=Streptococcus suis TaxID=1307 RepID=UPI00300F8868
IYTNVLKNECSEHKELTTFVVLGKISYKPPKKYIYKYVFWEKLYINIQVARYLWKEKTESGIPRSRVKAE